MSLVCGILIAASGGYGLAPASGQSLAEAARREAERRKALERQGVEGKVIVFNPEPSVPNQLSRKPSRPPPARASPSRAGSSVGQKPLLSLRSNLQKLDREIAQGEEKLKLLRSRLQAEKWRIPNVGRISRNSNSSLAQERLRSQIEDLEVKVKYWRRERSEIYENGRKSGFLPGELDGKGIVP